MKPVHSVLHGLMTNVDAAELYTLMSVHSALLHVASTTLRQRQPKSICFSTFAFSQSSGSATYTHYSIPPTFYSANIIPH